MGDHVITLAPEEEKALLWSMPSPHDWITNAVHNKARQAADAIIELALNDTTHTILTEAEKEQLVQLLADEGIIINTVKSLPPSVKRLIVQHARIKSAAEREAASNAQRP